MKRKKVLFVDDEPIFLATIQELFTAMAKGTWQVFTAQTHAQALVVLKSEQVSLIVLDIGMPVMDGIQFLRLLGQTHPGIPIAMLTGQTSEERKETSMKNGATLVLHKPIQIQGFQAIFSALDSLAGEPSQSGFRGVLRQVGLNDVLQMECLGRKASILEIFTSKVRGRIFISEGSIVHAESGNLEGEAALYGLLALRDGQFNLQPYKEPARRTIEGQWEFLLMEAARLSDEAAGESGAAPTTEDVAETFDTEIFTAEEPETSLDGSSTGFGQVQVAIEETLLCSGSGEVLYQFRCDAASRRRLLEMVEQQAQHLSSLPRVGRFDRVEIVSEDGRVVCMVKPDRRLFVRTRVSKIDA